jgi:hypothetical protein
MSTAAVAPIFMPFTRLELGCMTVPRADIQPERNRGATREPGSGWVSLTLTPSTGACPIPDRDFCRED